MVEDKDIPARIEVIEERRAEIAEYRMQKGNEWIPRNDMSFMWWTYFEASNYATLPFPGALIDQPESIMSDFAGFREIEEYDELGREGERLVERQAKNHG